MSAMAPCTRATSGSSPGMRRSTSCWKSITSSAVRFGSRAGAWSLMRSPVGLPCLPGPACWLFFMIGWTSSLCCMLRIMGGSPGSHEHDHNDALASRNRLRKDGPMDQDRARSLLIAERDEVQGLLKDAETAGQKDRQSEVDSEAGDIADAAQPLAAEGEDDAIAERLEADPAAELTIEEARAAERG